MKANMDMYDIPAVGIDVERETHGNIKLGGEQHGLLLLRLHRPQGLGHLSRLLAALFKKFIEHLGGVKSKTS